MAKDRPLFRFIGNPDGGVQVQFAAAQLAQDVFFRLSARQQVAENEVALIRKALTAAGVVVSQPTWFADLMRL